METIVTNTLVFLLTFLAMEGVGWLTHRYIMHGVGWFFHYDHHNPPADAVLQKNDLYCLVFSLPGVWLVYEGVQRGWGSSLLWAGIGISAYGMAYFYVHEGVIHRRFKFVPRLTHPYFVAIRHAHGAHHKTRGRQGAQCFGMLLVPPSFFIEAYRRQKVRVSQNSHSIAREALSENSLTKEFNSFH